MKIDINNFGEIRPFKILELQERIKRLNIDLDLIEESFVKGGGKGGQKINKTNNAVLLKYPPMNIIVKCQRERSRAVNRFLALRELVDKIEMKLSPHTSQKLIEIEKIRKRKNDKERKYRS